MYRPLINKKEQIVILQLTIDNYIGERGFGLCNMLYSSLKKYDNNSNDIKTYDDIKRYIPSFTKKNCTKLSEKYNFDSPCVYTQFWWNSSDDKNRLKCLNALLTELKK